MTDTLLAQVRTTEADARRATLDYESARARYAACLAREMDLVAQKPIEKDVAIRRTMAAMEAKGEKSSYTAAERIAEDDTQYGAHLTAIRNEVYAREIAYGQAEAARQQHALAIALLTLAAAEAPPTHTEAA